VYSWRESAQNGLKLTQLVLHRRAKEAEIEKKLVQREEAAMMKEKQYATLDQEVKDTKKKLKKLLHRHEVRKNQQSNLYAQKAGLNDGVWRKCTIQNKS
jgi:hypothetical protein